MSDSPAPSSIHDHSLVIYKLLPLQCRERKECKKRSVQNTSSYSRASLPSVHPLSRHHIDILSPPPSIIPTHLSVSSLTARLSGSSLCQPVSVNLPSSPPFVVFFLCSFSSALLLTSRIPPSFFIFFLFFLFLSLSSSSSSCQLV